VTGEGLEGDDPAGGEDRADGCTCALTGGGGPEMIGTKDEPWQPCAGRIQAEEPGARHDVRTRREGDRADGLCQETATQMPKEEDHSRAGEEEMGEDEERLPLGDIHRGQEPIGRIEQRGLVVGQQGCAHSELRVP
jgi:hypothetical protein